MDYRPLGRTGLQVSALGFGCSRIALADRGEATATLEMAVDRGISMFDTANAYEDDEALLGRVLGRHRERIVLCSKAGYRHWLQLETERFATIPIRRLHRKSSGGGGAPSPVSRRRNFSTRALRLAVEGSLRRLRTDCLDVLYLHSPPPDVLSDAAVFDALEQLKLSGRIRHYGIAFHETATTDAVVSALRRPGFGVVQVMSNPLAGVALERVGPAGRDAGVGIVARQLFHRGAALRSPQLTAMIPRVSGQSLAQAIVCATLQRDDVASAVVGMRSRAHLVENLQALALPPVTGV